jgi:hypothetical protein
VKKLFISATIFFFFSGSIFAQSGCPGCVINALVCPSFGNNELGHLCADSLPAAASNATYDVDITFQMNNQLAYRANDTLPGFPFTLGQLQTLGFPISPPITVDIDTARLVSVTGLPQGLMWTCDSAATGCYYSLPTSGNACFKICGTTDCYLSDTTITITIQIDFNQDLANLISAFSGGGPFPLPIPTKQLTSEYYTLDLHISASTALILDVTSSTGNDTITEGESVTLAATSGFADYIWSNNATSSSILVSPTQTTTYNCTVTDVNGCVQEKSFILFVEELPDTGSSVVNIKRKDLFRFYPNPAKNQIFVEYNLPHNSEIQIFNLQGKLLMTKNIVINENRKVYLDLNRFHKGLYIKPIN